MNLMKKERYVIIVAGGKGKRMQNNIPKQFLEVGGKPLIMRSVEAFFSFDNQKIEKEIEILFRDGL